MSALTVAIDERLRLVTAVLAAGEWPEREQARERHAVHPHSKQTRQFLAPHREHAAVRMADRALTAGVPLADLFTTAIRCSWPALTPQASLPASFPAGEWATMLADFARTTAVARFWIQHAAAWKAARDGLAAIFDQSQMLALLGQLRGEAVKSVMVMPTINYPMLEPVLAETAVTLFFVLPPAKAWGESPPWPHGEDPGWAVAQTCWHLADQFLAEPLAALNADRQAELRHAIVTLCLEQELNEAEAMAYLVRSKKEHDLPRLPEIVAQLRAHLAADGRSLTTFIEHLVSGQQ